MLISASAATVAEGRVRQPQRCATGGKNSPHIFCAFLVVAFLLLHEARAQDDQPTVISFKSAKDNKRRSIDTTEYYTYTTDAVDATHAADAGQASQATASLISPTSATLLSELTQVVVTENYITRQDSETTRDSQVGTSSQENNSNITVSTSDALELTSTEDKYLIIKSSTQWLSTANTDHTTTSPDSDYKQDITTKTKSSADEHVVPDKHTPVVPFDSSTEQTSQETQEPLTGLFVFTSHNYTTRSSQVASTEQGFSQTSLVGREEEDILVATSQSSLVSTGLQLSQEQRSTIDTEVLTATGTLSEVTPEPPLHSTEKQQTSKPLFKVLTDSQQSLHTEALTELPGHNTQSTHEEPIQPSVHQPVCRQTPPLQVATQSIASTSSQHLSPYLHPSAQTATPQHLTTSASKTSAPSSSEIPFQTLSNLRSTASAAETTEDESLELTSNSPKSTEPTIKTSIASTVNIILTSSAASLGPTEATASKHLLSSHIPKEPASTSEASLTASIGVMSTIQNISTDSETTAEYAVTSSATPQNSSLFGIKSLFGIEENRTFSTIDDIISTMESETVVTPCINTSQAALISEKPGPHDHLYALAFHITLGLCVGLSVIIICFFATLVCFAKYKGWKKRMNVLPTVIVGDVIDKGRATVATATSAAAKEPRKP